MMAHKAMKQRHWERISTITGVTLDVESETFQLRQLMSAPLLPNKEDIEVHLDSDTNEMMYFIGMPCAAFIEFLASLKTVGEKERFLPSLWRNDRNDSYSYCPSKDSLSTQK